MYAVRSDSSTAGLPREFLAAQMSPEHMDEVKNLGLRNHGCHGSQIRQYSCFCEPVIFYQAEAESTRSIFFGSKERVRIDLKSSHKRLKTFRKYLATLWLYG